MTPASSGPRVALISGAGSRTGIGFATAEKLGESGMEVFITASSERIFQRAEELRDKGIRANAFQADLTQNDQLKALIDSVSRQTQRIDVVVANHGMTSVGHPMATTGETGSVFDLELQHFEFALDRNLVSVFNLLKHCLPFTRVSATGRIALVGSVTGGLMATRGDAAYATAKAALLGLTRSLALDEARYSTTVNLVAPGWIATESQTESERLQGLATPVGRSGTPEEVAAVIAFICSESASYLTGQMLTVDGGNSIAEERSV